VDKLKVNRGDFFHALDEVHPAFGVAEEELQQVVQNGIIHYDIAVDVSCLPRQEFVLLMPHFCLQSLLHDGQLFVEQVRSSQRTPLVTVLLHGPPGSGKTAMAATIAQASGFPFIKLVSPESMVGMNEPGKVLLITKAFVDSYKSPLSVIVVDNIERLLGELECVAVSTTDSNIYDSQSGFRLDLDFLKEYCKLCLFCWDVVHPKDAACSSLPRLPYVRHLWIHN
jgi:vesicle-fusing ATPase